MANVGSVLRKESVVAVYLVHGTFTGNDTGGFIRQLGRLVPTAREWLQQLAKQTVDRLVQDYGNYTQRYQMEMEQAINADATTSIPVRRFTWTGENHHFGRADGAVRLIDEIQMQLASSEGRVLFWGHSHAGNVFALMTNLLATDRPTRQRFFRAARGYFLSGRSYDTDAWQRVHKVLLHSDENPLQNVRLDYVTFGTPIRYGWDTDGYGRLLHFVFHRPTSGNPEHLASFPLTVEQIRDVSGGDIAQQLGIAGTNLPPNFFNLGTWLANRRLGRILQEGVRSRDLVSHLRTGTRIAEEGTSLLVDYGTPPEHWSRHLLGHAVYTQRDWMLFHAEQVVKWMYRSQ